MARQALSQPSRLKTFILTNRFALLKKQLLRNICDFPCQEFPGGRRTARTWTEGRHDCAGFGHDARDMCGCRKTVRFRVDPEKEVKGLDHSLHGEHGYGFGAAPE